ncbi:Exodeoxyribonuclease 7 large subunit [Thalassocella blandensis]|nr:Exodeoxyribonuclease 7 large subunit [Thalassocella blandensis]
MVSSSPQDSDIYSVTQLNRSVKQLLEKNFPMVWVEGEISNFTQPSSGHWYFTLKDAGGQIRCAMFRGNNMYIKPRPKAGDKVKVRGRVSLYEGRGDFQLIIEHLEAAGFGELQRQFEKLKLSLQQEGLFDPAAKQAVPTLPRHIAAITSPSGAAIRDVISVLKRRMPSIPITIIPCAVQGEEAPRQLLQALDIAERREEFDVILLCRGGGSIEDLWAFNNEMLARRIYQCKKPIVSAVGHEIDFTIADFVADVRAPTPSAAAELLSPNGQELSLRFSSLARQLEQGILRQLSHKLNLLTQLNKRLKHPRDKLEQFSQALDQLEIRLTQGVFAALKSQKKSLEYTQNRLIRENPAQGIEQEKLAVLRLKQKLTDLITAKLRITAQRLEISTYRLNGTNPLNIMSRGYSITTNCYNKIIQSVKDVELDEELYIKLSDGTIKTKVTEKP